METTKKLFSILQLINDWLKFAEAKNAVLLTFCGAGITAVITYLSASENVPNSLRIGLVISMSLLCIGSLICSLSFLPKTDMDHFIWLKAKPNRNPKLQLKDTDNFYFFNDLKKYSSVDLLDSINRLYCEGKSIKPYRKEDLDIANQITINAEIASKKFMFFRAALWSLIFSILVTPASLFISLLIYRKI
jgi:hypothetical protein